MALKSLNLLRRTPAVTAVFLRRVRGFAAYLVKIPLRIILGGLVAAGTSTAQSRATPSTARSAAVRKSPRTKEK